MLSCNRAQGVQRAEEIVELALRYAKRKRFCNPACISYGECGVGWVAGLEFSGNPMIGSFEQYSDIFLKAMKGGLW